jgi:hypothetical protein
VTRASSEKYRLVKATAKNSPLSRHGYYRNEVYPPQHFTIKLNWLPLYQCDRQLPECSACRRQSMTCKWSRRKTTIMTARHKKYQQVIELFDALPEHEAAQILHEFTTRRTTAAFVLPKQISELDLIRNTLWPSQSNVELELNVRYPVAYPALYPLSVAALTLETLLGPHTITQPRCVDPHSICSYNCNQGAAYCESTASQHH